MSEVKRYALNGETKLAEENSNGFFVSHDDYAALKESAMDYAYRWGKAQDDLKVAHILHSTQKDEIATLQQKLEASEALMLAMRDDSRESRSKMELVVAENAALKESRKRLGEFILEEIDADYPLNMDVKTPATDAMVNEIRAEGVELYADATIAIGKSENDEAIIYAGNQALLFANQLRADATKGGSDD